MVHTEAQTFERKQAATAWLKRRETELAEPGALEKTKVVDPTLAEVIDRYTVESERKIGRTKTQVLRSIKDYGLAAMRCSTITSADILAFAQELDVQPQTVSNYLSHLGAVFSIARPAWSYPLDPSAMKDAFKVANKLGVTAKGGRRNRRPTLAELDKIMEHFTDRKKRRPSSNPMPHIVAFAIFSTRRLDEITRIKWSDLDEAHSRVMVRDMKNPGEKAGNDVLCDLPAEALQIVRAMPRKSSEIFPFGTDAIGAAFTRAMALLGIDDLHFHDLRHEGVSRLFEMGRTIPQVAIVSGHRSWSSLQRYAHVRQSGDKFAGWAWLETVTNREGA